MGGHNGIGAVTFAAAGSWRASEGGGAPLISENCVITNPSPGRFDVTLDQPLNETDFMAGFCWLNAVPPQLDFSLEHVSDLVKRFHFRSRGTQPLELNESFSFIFTKGSGRHA